MHRFATISVLSLIMLAGCASAPSTPVDPYPGSGGLILGTPSAADVASGRSVFSRGKLDFATIGKTTKSEVAAALGKPAWWLSDKDGNSRMGYDFVEETSFMGMRKVVRVSFAFDTAMVLTKVDRPR